MRTFGPRPATAPKKTCILCDVAFEEGNYTTLIALLPADSEELEKAESGLEYNAVATEVHVHCAEELTGEKVDP